MFEAKTLDHLSRIRILSSGQLDQATAAQCHPYLVVGWQLSGEMIFCLCGVFHINA